jgi:hypothetical protein
MHCGPLVIVGQFASMMRVIGGLGLGCMFCFALFACSSDDGGSGHGGAGSSTDGGTTDAGSNQGGTSAGTGGSSSGGTSKSGGAGGTNSSGSGGESAGAQNGGTAGAAAAQCSPGTTLHVDDAMSAISTCADYDPYLIKQPKGTPIFVYDITVDPMPAAGATTALSAQFSSGKHPKMELWTTGDECGIADQRMGTATAGPGAACIQRTAANPAPHFLLVLYEDAPLEQVTVCAMGACP